MTKLKEKTIMDYIAIDSKSKLNIISVDKKGKISKITETGDEALSALKKFVAAL